MLLLDLVMFNDYNPEKQREIIADVMHIINDTVVFFCRLAGSSNMRFLVGMNTIATKMFLLMYDPMINPKLNECRGTIPQPISINKEFLSLVNEYNTLLMEYNQYLNMRRFNTEYLSVTPGGTRTTESTAPRPNVSFETPIRSRQRTETEDDVADDGYISSDDDSFGGFDISKVM
jgi:hypothetical protein